ncbi:FtsK/SpoIIIE domain-containing protein [Cellulomonas sp. URHE0023]|uniref:FtsK/SpoIIIE domain-containing protein n=1 Tax=Cellulomonas sp. URHE0023 TaxID=1380354 RepID=UPI0004897228|nr:FtsK/SpoIIIE domain-containing protein [Cellulomonas sp. URHE0023]
MRLTLLHPDPDRGAGTVTTDVEVLPGTALALLRPALARLSGDPAWASSAHRVFVAQQVLDDSHVAGHVPLVHGCVLSLGPDARPSAEEALRADWHVAVVAGPDCGVRLGLRDNETLEVAPGFAVRRRGDRVRIRRGRPSPRWRPDAEHIRGDTTYAVRPRTPAEPSRVAPAPARPPVATWLTPLIGSAALAVALHQPLLALVGLVGPLGALRLRRRRQDSDGASAPADPAALEAATVRARPDDEPIEAAVPWDDGGTVAIVGPRALALPVARATVLAALGTHAHRPLSVHSLHLHDWSWCVWAGAGTAGLPGLDEGSAVVVVDGPPDPAALALWRSAAPPAQRAVVLAARAADVPAWCRSRIEVSRGSVRVHGPQGATSLIRRHAVTERTAEAQLRRAAGLGAVRTSGSELAAQATLGAQPGIPAAEACAVSSAWDEPRPGLVVALGDGAAGRPFTVDLVADGPHALVAGTTGAGKSELLTTLVLAVALTHPPERLSILLVDFKGGTGLGAVAGLPHVLEHVTDLDAPQAHRVLSGLRAELRRRERLLVAAGARDIAELDPQAPATPSRLLVVVDELRALTEDVPEASAALARLAAQGRALGVHLVLATQRPAGAVGADLRANVSLRIALRVADPADSVDVLDVPDAAAIDPGTPGRALVRRGSRAAEVVQVARATTAPQVAPARLAAPWGSSVTRWTPGSQGRDTDAAPAWVAAAVEAATPRPTSRPPWLPALPSVVAAEDVDLGPGVALAVADLPDEQRRGAVRWDPSTGHLLVLGGPRSGRSTTLVTVGLGALAQGWAVHALGLPEDSAARLRAGDEHGILGTLLGVDDAVETARLLELLDRSQGRPSVLLVDRVDLVLGALGELARGAGADRLTAFWRGGRALGGAAVAASADVGAVAAQHAGAFRDRVVLPLADQLLDSLAGVPSVFAGPRDTAGRAIHLGPGGAQLVQVALPSEAVHTQATPDPAVVRVRRLPRACPLPDAGPRTVRPRTVRPDAWHVLLGPGSDDAEPIGVDVSQGLLIAGPPGSGRSSALAVVARGLVRAGRTVRLLRTGPSSPVLAGIPTTTPGEVSGLDDTVTLLVDDLDELEREHPDLGDTLVRRVVATSTAHAAAGAYRGALPELLRRRRVLVLDLHDAASAELVGIRSRWLADPGRRTAGRGALVVGRAVTPVQVYDPA